MIEKQFIHCEPPDVEPWESDIDEFMDYDMDGNDDEIENGNWRHVPGLVPF
jgi:hypothetical protein